MIGEDKTMHAIKKQKKGTKQRFVSTKINTNGFWREMKFFDGYKKIGEKAGKKKIIIAAV